MLDLASESCGAMVRLVSRLVEAHAMEEAGAKLHLAPQDLRDICSGAAERLRTTAEGKQQQIVLGLPPAPAIAQVDAALLGQVLENLLGNALKFSPRDARVELALTPAQEGAWRIDVMDDGPGVPEGERPRLFEKFHRGHARPTEGESSTGLGLHIVKTLTETMRGRVSHVPRAGGGSIFRVELVQR